MNTQNLKAAADESKIRLLKSLSLDKQEAWLKLNEKLEEILQREVSAPDYDIEMHEIELRNVIAEMDAVTGIGNKKPKSNKNSKSMLIIVCILMLIGVFALLNTK